MHAKGFGKKISVKFFEGIYHFAATLGMYKIIHFIFEVTNKFRIHKKLINNLFKIIQYFSGKKIIFPFYHIVSDEDCPHVKHLYPIKKVAKFEEELDFLQKHYRAIDLEELMSHVQNGTQPEEPSFFLSFDDGLRECSTVIAPILKKRNIPAAIFLNTGFVGNQNLFYRYKISLIIEVLRTSSQTNGIEFRISEEELLKLTYHDSDKIDQIAQELNIDFDEFLRNERPYMNWDEIEELKKQGFYFGGHSVDHPLYKSISLEEQLSQTQKSVDETVQKLNLDYRIFSFPFTDDGVKKEFFEKVYSDKICDLTFSTKRMKKDEFPQNIHRFGLEPNHGSTASFFIKQYLVFIFNSILNKNKIHR